LSILQRYVFRELIGPILISTFFFSFLMMLRQLFSFAELLLEARVEFAVLLELVGVIAATLIVVTVPMASLLGSLIGVGRLTSENEILAMRVAGLSLGRIFYPVFMAAAVVSAGLMWFGFDTLPGMAKNLSDRRDQIGFKILTELEPVRLYDLDSIGTRMTLFYEERLPAEAGDGPYTLRMSQIAIRIEGAGTDITGASIDGSDRASAIGEGDVEEEKRETLVFAEKGVIRGNLEKRLVSLELSNGTAIPISFSEVKNEAGRTVDYRRPNPENETTLQFDRMSEDIPLKREEWRLDARTVPMGTLRTLIAKAPEGEMFRDEKKQDLTGEWRNYLGARNEYYQRISLPWSLLAFVLVAIPLAVELRPRAKTLSFIIALALLVAYYVMFSAANAAGMANHPLTFAAYMAPNVILGAVGILLFWRVQR